MDLTVRYEEGRDRSSIHTVNVAAFGRADEANLVADLRRDGVVLASLVAEINEHVVGHILFSRMSIETANGAIPAVALAPLAIFPEYQRQGIGGRLIRDGLDLLRKRGERVVIVLGHPEYYPRFGFLPGKARLLESPFPPEAFMAMELIAGALDGIKGKVKYPAAFGI